MRQQQSNETATEPPPEPMDLQDIPDASEVKVRFAERDQVRAIPKKRATGGQYIHFYDFRFNKTTKP